MFPCLELDRDTVFFWLELLKNYFEWGKLKNMFYFMRCFGVNVNLGTANSMTGHSAISEIITTFMTTFLKVKCLKMILEPIHLLWMGTLLVISVQLKNPPPVL